jgi:hypothetical protein
MLRLAEAVALAPVQLVGIAQPGRTRERKARFLKRRLSLPVSTMS